MGVIAAAGIGAAASVGGSIFSGIFSSAASQKQAAAIRYSADVAKETALELDKKARADMAPFRKMGVESGELISSILRGEANLDDLLKPSSLFKWQEEQGSRNINRELSARGLYGSGAGLETLARFNRELVADEGERYWNRLFNVTTLGSNAAARMATNTASTGQSVSNMMAQAGMAAAQSEGDAGRALAGIGSDIGAIANRGMQNYMYGQLLQRSTPAPTQSQFGPYESGYKFDYRTFG